MRVLVTGGAGYIGSVAVEELLAYEHTPIVYDNLSKGFRESVASGAEFIRGELLDHDLARAHVLSLGLLSRQSDIFNLGCGGGYTVLEVIEAARQVPRRPIPLRIGLRRPGDPAILVASSDKIQKDLGWRPQQQDLCTIIESAWKWIA